MNAWRVVRAILLFPGTMVKAVWSGGRRLLLSARAWVLFALLVIAALVAYYVLSDRYSPFTSDAYVQAYVIQVAPRVEGQVVVVHVRENQAVKKGEMLFEIDPRPFQHSVELLIAKKALAVQQVAQLEADLSAAKADDVRLAAEDAYAKTVFEQEKGIYKQQATTDRKYVEAVQNAAAAQAAVERSRAQVRKAEKSNLTVVTGGRELLNDFYDVLAQNMRDLGSPVHGKGFYDELLATFENESRLLVVRLGQQAIAASLVSQRAVRSSRYGSVVRRPAWFSTASRRPHGHNTRPARR